MHLSLNSIIIGASSFHIISLSSHFRFIFNLFLDFNFISSSLLCLFSHFRSFLFIHYIPSPFLSSPSSTPLHSPFLSCPTSLHFVHFQMSVLLHSQALIYFLFLFVLIYPSYFLFISSSLAHPLLFPRDFRMLPFANSSFIYAIKFLSFKKSRINLFISSAIRKTEYQHFSVHVFDSCRHESPIFLLFFHLRPSHDFLRGRSELQ